MKSGARAGVAVLGVALYVSLGWVAGLGVLVVAVVAVVGRTLRTRRALAPTTLCPWCASEVQQYGAFECRACGVRGLGWVWRCASCAAWAGHVRCESCGMSVTNPVLGRAS